MKEKSIGIIGFGNMGSTIAQCIKSDYQLIVFDKDKTKTSNLENIDVADNVADLADKSEVIILAVKPQDFDNLLNKIHNQVQGKLIISIAAGIPTDYIEKRLTYVRVVRTMPNLLAKVGMGMTFIYKGVYATNEDVFFVEKLFNHLGKTWIIYQEEIMDIATAVTGTGPACCIDIVEFKKINYHRMPEEQKMELVNQFKEAAIAVGFNSQDSELLASSVVEGIIVLLNQSGLTPGELKRQITSRGGTTEAALEVLHSGGSMKEALQAAVRRAKELSKKE